MLQQIEYSQWREYSLRYRNTNLYFYTGAVILLYIFLHAYVVFKNVILSFSLAIVILRTKRRIEVFNYKQT